MGGSKGGGQVIGYKYYLGIDFAWCHAPIDRCTAFWLDNREIYRGCFTDGTITINKPELFGEFEGGISGYIDLETGAEDQTANTYTVSQTGSDTPAYRGINRTIFRGRSTDGSSRAMYVGNNPYLKKVTGEFQRIYKRIRDGAVVDQWQNSIAGVPLIDQDTAGLTLATGTIADQSIFINVDLSSSSNGFVGQDGTITGNGGNIDTIRASVIESLVDIRDRLQWENRGTLDFKGDDSGDSGLDIGVGYTRFTTGSQDNTSNNPNSVDPYLAPVDIRTDSTYNLPKRGWKMKENATVEDIDDLIEFVNNFVVVPDTVGDNLGETRELAKKLYNNLDEAFATLSTTNLRGHVVYSAMVTDESQATIASYYELIEDVLLTNAGSTDHPIKGVYGPSFSQYNSSPPPQSGVGDNGDGSAYLLNALINPSGFPPDGRWEISNGGWYLIARSTPVLDTDWRQGGSLSNPNSVGNRILVDNPAGGGVNAPPFGLPEPDWKTWYFGPYKPTGIYARRFDIVEHWQRDSTAVDTELSVNRDGDSYTYKPYHDQGTKITVQSDDGGISGLWMKNICGGYVEMNPAHIIRECLTDQQWGLGLPESDIDETSFAAAAQTLYDERFGLSMAWQRETPIEDFVNVVLNHIDAVLYVDRSDGLFHLVLIRDDYDPETIDSFNDDDVVDWVNIGIKSPAELVNSVTIKYNSRELRGEASLTVKNFAQIQKLGKTISTTVNYPGIWQDTLATRVAQRDLITLSTSLIAGEIVLTRKAYDIAPGDVFKLTSSRYNLSGEVMRVVEVNVGDGRQNSVRVKFTQDKYNFDYSEDTDLVNTPDSEWTDPGATEPDTVEDRVVTEEPYYLFVQRNGEALAEEIELREQNVGYVFAVAQRPTTNSVYSRMFYDDGSGYVLGPQVPYGPIATLDADLVEEADDTTVTLSNFEYPEDVSVNDLIQIGDEIMRVDSLDSATQITVARGALDTVPAYHYATLPVFFIGSNGVITTDYVASDSIDVKLLDSTNRGQLSSALSYVDTVVMDNRITKPYAVGQLQLDGAYSGVWDTSTGTIEATWVHRDRTLQNTTTPPVHVDSSVGPETDNNYTISAVAYDLLGDELTSIGDLFSVDKNQDTSHTITPSSYTPTSEGTVQWSAVGVRVKTTREESTSEQYDNWQTPEVIAFWPLEPNEIEFYSGAWVDANQLSTVWETVNKTTNVTSDGDPVGYMENVRDKY